MSISIPTAHKILIAPKYGNLKSIINWCNTNCKSDWRFDEESSGEYTFFFESEKDFVAFTLCFK